MVSTVKRKEASIKRFYRMAFETGLTSHNWSNRFRAPTALTARNDQLSRRPQLTAKQVSQLLNSPNIDTPIGKRDRAILALMTMHGLEVGEIQSLDLNDVRYDQGKPNVLHVVGRGRKERDIPLSAKSSSLLQAWIEERNRWLIEKNYSHQDEHPLFIAMIWGGPFEKRGQRISVRGIRGIVDEHLKTVEAKIEGLSCHALRHAYASLSLPDDNESLQKLWGCLECSVIKTTRIYPI